MESKGYKCTKCVQLFTSQELFKKHMKCEHGNRQKWNCNECGKSFSRKEHVDRHIRITHHQESVVCSVCQATLSDKYKLRFHQVHQHNYKKCRFCTKVFEKDHKCPKRAVQENEERKKEGFPCVVCLEKFESDALLTAHMSEKHPLPEPTQIENPFLNKEFNECNQCFYKPSENCYFEEQKPMVENFYQFSLLPQPPYWFANPSSNPYGYSYQQPQVSQPPKYMNCMPQASYVVSYQRLIESPRANEGPPQLPVQNESFPIQGGWLANNQ